MWVLLALGGRTAHSIWRGADATPLSAARALACCMGKYVAIFNGAATEETREKITPEDSSAFIARWGAWATGLGEALLDPGAPLYRKIRLTADAATPFEDSKTGYAIVDAASHEQAVEMFATHPHLELLPGNSIEIIECPAPPA